MKLVRDTTLSAAGYVYPLRPPQPSLCVAVKATFALSADQAVCVLLPEQPPCSGDVFHDDDVSKGLRYASDLAPVKSRGECFVGGTLRPTERRVTVAKVAFRIGSVGRNMVVFGDRVWRSSLAGAMTAPEPFESMPLQWERAFGGPGFDANPVGLGIASVPSNEGPRVALPNLEDPEALIQTRGDRPKPIDWFPISPSWRSRSSRLGTYDARWAKQRWPYPAEDFDIEHFQACAPAMQIQGFWRGDEDIVLEGLVPGHRRVSTRLPALRPHAGIAMADGRAGSPLRPIPLVLDTISIDLDAMAIHCVWRGAIEAPSESLEEIAHLFVCETRLGEKMDGARLRERFDDKLARDAGEDVEPEPVAEPEANAPAPRKQMPAVDLEYQQLEARVAAAVGAAAAPPRQSMPSPEDLRAMIMSLSKAEGAPKQQLEELFGDPPPPAPISSPPAPRRGPLDRERVLASWLVGDSLRERDLTNADLSGLALEGVDFSGSILCGARLTDGSFDKCIFDGAVLIGADLSRAKMAGASFRGADLSKVRGHEVDLRGATLEEAVLLDADLTGAKLQGAAGTEMNATGATFVRADLTEAKLDEAIFTRARLAHATLTRASLTRADMSGADASHAELTEADLTRFRASEGAKFADAVLRKIRGDGSIWLGARLERANFTFSSLERADFSNASLVQAALHGCNLKSATFRAARLVGAGMHKSDASGSSFESADLSHADLRGSNFHEAAFWRAKHEGANLELAIVTGTLLAGES